MSRYEDWNHWWRAKGFSFPSPGMKGGGMEAGFGGAQLHFTAWRRRSSIPPLTRTKDCWSDNPGMNDFGFVGWVISRAPHSSSTLLKRQ